MIQEEEDTVEGNCMGMNMVCTEIGSDGATICHEDLESTGEPENSERGMESSRRESPSLDGIYVKGYLQGKAVNLTIDSGCTSTIVSTRFFYSLPEVDRPSLTPSNKSLENADGNQISYLGRGVFTIHLGPLCMEKELNVAGIKDDVLVGADILLKDPCGPADILASQGVMKLRGESIPLELVGIEEPPEYMRQVRSADHYIIPGKSEGIVDVFVDPPSLERGDNKLLVEGAPQLAEKYSLVMAPSLVDATSRVTVRVRILNPLPSPASIKQDMVIGQCAPVDVLGELLEEEEGGWRDNFASTKPLGVQPPQEWTRQVQEEVKTSVPQLPSHLDGLFDNATRELDEDESQQVKEFLCEFQHVFSRDESDLGLTHLAEHVIDTGNATPIKQPPRRVPMAFVGEDKKAIDQLLKQGTIRPSTSPWASPIVLVRKRSGQVRPCIDYRRINAVTRKDAFPLPRTQDCLDAVAGAKMFSTMDITSAYNQIPVREADIPKTAFVSKHGLFEYTTMPFGLCNAPATFQRVMEIALAGLQWNSALIYLDDVIVFGNTFSEHTSRLRLVVDRIAKAGLKLKPEKCQLFQKEVVFLGHIIGADGVLPNPENVAKLVRLPEPRTQTEVRALLGMGSYYRRFIRDYSEKMQPLIQLTKKHQKFDWTPACQEAFEQLKRALTGPEIMAYPKDEGEFILDTDASGTAIGAVLSQIQDGRERVIAYGSKILGKAERNYCVTDRELLAVKYFVEYYKHYLLGRTFRVRSDHQALKWLFSLREPKNRIARWIEILSAYHFMVEYRPGKKHGNADAMSRCVNPRECQCDMPEEPMLECGPCQKCQKRSDDMCSSLTAEYHRAGRTLSVVRRRVGLFWSFVLYLLAVICGYVDVVGLSGSDMSSPTLLQNSAVPRPAPISAPTDDGRCRPKLSKVFGIWQSVQDCISEASRGCIRRVTRSQANPSWAQVYSPAVMRKKQLEDLDVGPVLRWYEGGKRPYGAEVSAASPATRHYWNCWDSLAISGGVLYRKFMKKDATGTYWQLLVPRSVKKEVLHQMHSSLLSGHLGKKKTKEKALQRYYWFGIREDIDIWVKQCDECGAIKVPTKTARAPLGKMTAGAPMDRLATDILGPLPETERGNQYILVVTDAFTKWVEVFPVPDWKASTCAQIILNEVISRFGCPYDMHSDQGRNYESQLFSQLCKLLEIRKTRTSPGNPRCNGQTERFNKTLVRMIKAYLKGQQRDWDLHLGCLAAAYRATPNESTGLTPNLLMLGREVRLPAELMFGSGTTQGEDVETYGDYVDMLKSRIQHAHDVARTHLQKAAEKQKQDYDAKTCLTKFKVGDYVWYRTDISQLATAPKLRVPYEGPYVIVKRLNDLNYVIQLNAKGSKKLVHHNRLKPYFGNKKFNWVNAAIKKAQHEA